MNSRGTKPPNTSRPHCSFNEGKLLSRLLRHDACKLLILPSISCSNWRVIIHHYFRLSTHVPTVLLHVRVKIQVLTQVRYVPQTLAGKAETKVLGQTSIGAHELSPSVLVLWRSFGREQVAVPSRRKCHDKWQWERREQRDSVWIGCRGKRQLRMCNVSTETMSQESDFAKLQPGSLAEKFSRWGK